MITRRRLLAGGLAGGALLPCARVAEAIGGRSQFRFAQIKTDGRWNPRPASLRRIALELQKRTSISVDLTPIAIDLEDPGLHETPFLYLSGDGAFSLPNTTQIANLRRFLTYGGFLLIDSAEERADGSFDRSARKLMEAVFPPPAESFRIVPRDHVLYRSFYLIKRPVGRRTVSPVLDGIIRDQRLTVLYSKNDLGGAGDRDTFGNYTYQCTPGGERQREYSFRLGVNIVMYALCLEYKTDQVHVDFLMKRRKWRTAPESSSSDAPGNRPKRRRNIGSPPDNLWDPTDND